MNESMIYIGDPIHHRNLINLALITCNGTPLTGDTSTQACENFNYSQSSSGWGG
jgi:hypothetical protein